jgi:cystathionine beta-lyase
MLTASMGALDPQRLRSGHGAKWTAVPASVIPAWVADMDLGIPPAVAAAMKSTIDRQDLGYPYWPHEDPVVRAFTERMSSRYGWQPAPGRTRVFSDLIQILQIIIEYTTAPGDTVALHVPNYPPFLAAIQRAGRTVIPLRFTDAADAWELDLDQHRAAFARHAPRLLIVVNPHNPTGRVLRRDELLALADLALTQGIPVFSDEIHADLTHEPHAHVPFASLDSAVADLTITATSATKAFNLAGTRCAVAHIGHEPTARALGRAPLDYFGTPGVLSRLATVAAWEQGDSWHREVTLLLRQNRSRIAEWAAGHPELTYHQPEATYLSWFDFSTTSISADPAAHILAQAAVQLSPGADFSAHTDIDTGSYARLNFATTPATLEEILSRIDRCL